MLPLPATLIFLSFGEDPMDRLNPYSTFQMPREKLLETDSPHLW